MSGGTGVTAAATDPRVAGAILLCPYLDGRARALSNLRADPRNALWLLWRAMRGVAGGHEFIPVTAQPGGRAAMTLDGEADGFTSMITTDSPWRNAIAAGPLIAAAFYRPVTKARKLSCPILVQLCERDITSPARAIEKLAQKAPRAELKRYDMDHFQPFYGDKPSLIAADQATWLKGVEL
jgi:pimeloyl-ACP methyl ester carboxylesterase